MFQQFASELAVQKDLFLAGLGLAFGLFGFLLAQFLFPKFIKPLHKVGFAFWLALLYLIGAVAFVFLQGMRTVPEADPALLGKYLMGGYGLVLVLGIAFGVCARARSNSIFGRDRFAFLALIPGLNAVFAVWKPTRHFRSIIRPSGTRI